MISASQRRVKMQEFAEIPPTDTRADARIIILGRIVIVSISIIIYIVLIHFHKLVSIIILIIMTSFAPISSKIKLSGATKPRG